MNEEHKMKIGLANKVSVKEFYGKNPTYRNSGMFKKGHKPIFTGKGLPQIREENHPNWNGGVQTYRKMLLRRGFKLDKCSECGGKKMIQVHHIDEDRRNNDLENLKVMCIKCHNNFHGSGKSTRFMKGHKVSREVRMKISKANKKRFEL